MTELKLEVGKTYVDSRGNQAFIVLNPTYPRNQHFPFYSNGNTYTVNGKFYLHDEHSSDLVSEYTPPAAAPQPAARTPHKWANEMHAFADGHEIEAKAHGRATWDKDQSPAWYINYEYRIKPEPAPLKPNSTVFLGILENGFGSYAYETSRELKNTGCLQAIRIEFNPNDQSLVSAEVVTL